MGILNWIERKGNIGGTARAVARGWKTIQSQNPEMEKVEIGKQYIQIRYGNTGETDLEISCLGFYYELEPNPLNLAWSILLNENQNELDYVESKYNDWRKIISEEISKMGISPD